MAVFLTISAIVLFFSLSTFYLKMKLNQLQMTVLGFELKQELLINNGIVLEQVNRKSIEEIKRLKDDLEPFIASIENALARGSSQDDTLPFQLWKIPQKN